jgi:transcriptional regulator with XRE-family HTH domain
VCKALGLSNSITTTWKDGYLPNPNNLKLIADYFGVLANKLKDGIIVENPNGAPPIETPFWRNFQYLCRRVGAAPTPLGEVLGFSSATTTPWRHGVIPREASLQKIADHFGIFVDDLRDGDLEAIDKGLKSATQWPLTKQATELLDIFVRLSLRNQTELLHRAYALEEGERREKEIRELSVESKIG